LSGVCGRWWARALACQRTLRGPVRLTGVALHSGADAVAEILPAPPGTGVVFRVTACAGQWVDIPADLSHAGESPRSTCLSLGDCRVDMVEHFLAALYGMGIDNAVVVVSGGEPPGLDGSCRPLVDAIGQVSRMAGGVQSNSSIKLGQIRQHIYAMDQINAISIATRGEGGRIVPQEALQALFSVLERYEVAVQTATGNTLELRTLLLTHLMSLQELMDDSIR